MDYFNIYKDVWNFHKKYADVKEDEVYWDNLLSESKQIAKKYNFNTFVKTLLLAVIDELERVYKEMRQNADRAI